MQLFYWVLFCMAKTSLMLLSICSKAAYNEKWCKQQCKLSKILMSLKKKWNRCQLNYTGMWFFCMIHMNCIKWITLIKLLHNFTVLKNLIFIINNTFYFTVHLYCCIILYYFCNSNFTDFLNNWNNNKICIIIINNAIIILVFYLTVQLYYYNSNLFPHWLNFCFIL